MFNVDNVRCCTVKQDILLKNGINDVNVLMVIH